MKAEAERADQAGVAGTGRNPGAAAARAEADMATRTRTKAGVATTSLMEAVVERGNLMLAYQRVVANKGAAGVDALTVTELKDHLKRHWPTIRARLLAGTYHPQPVRRVDIPKPQGGVRTLGIPTVVDRLIQQALHQVLQPIFEPTFSAASYGFRPGRNAHQAVRQARQYVAQGKRWVVDMDLEKFFDRVNHDLLMSKLAAKIGDARVLTLIRRHLQAGMMADGLVQPRTEGTPQGGPLSPLLSNILLTDLDRELERRGHAFCRYADDCNIYVGSERAGVELLQNLTQFLADRLKLTVNEAKSAVARPWQRKFLGYSMTWHREPKLRIAAPSLRKLTGKVNDLLRGARGRSIGATIQTLNPVLRGWAAYFKLTATKRALEERDGWVRHKLRCTLWRQWKRPHARARQLMQRGLTEERAWRSACNQRGPWWNAGASHMHAAFPKSWFDHLGLVSLLDTVQHLQRAS
jgi:RNA-directed DNA polymerase